MNLKYDERGQNLGHFILGAAFFIGFVLWVGSHGVINYAAMWLTLMGAVALGMRLVGRNTRRELAERRKADWDEQSVQEYERNQLEACRQRRERREATRAGDIEDDGLSEFGREMAERPIAKKLTQDLEDLGVDFPPVEENSFDLEEGDKKLEVAWKRRVAAEAAWRKALAK